VFLPVYLFALSLSSGLVGAFAHRFLAEQGFVPDIEMGLSLTLGIATAFAALQLAYMAFVYFVAPARGSLPLLAESLALGAAIVLTPYLLRVPIPWPDPRMEQFEPLAYLGVFGLLHIGCKLLALFSAMHSQATTRLVVLGWLAVAWLAGAYSLTTLNGYRQALAATRDAEPPAAELSSVKQVYADAWTMVEGNQYTLPVDVEPGEQLTFYMSFGEETPDVPETLHLVVVLNGTEADPIVEPVTVNYRGWTAFHVPAVEIPADTTECQLIWAEEEEPEWMTQLGVRPIAHSRRVMRMSGPHVSRPMTAQSPPSLVLISVDGLAAEHMAFMGYQRETTPGIDAWAADALLFSNCYTVAPETAAATMSMFTAQSPLHHGRLGGHQRPLPEEVTLLAEELREAGYLTLACTEGQSSVRGAGMPDDLVVGTGFERGFVLFDQTYTVTAKRNPQGLKVPGGFMPAGSAFTLERAQRWVDSHANVPFFLYIRLRELENPQPLSRYGDQFHRYKPDPAPVDVYDTALAQVDGQIAGFLAWLDSTLPEERVAVALTSPYGLDFSGGERAAGGRYLTESSLHVPLVMKVPNTTPRVRRTLMNVMDIGPALLGLAGEQYPEGVPGTNALDYSTDRPVVSMGGEPLALSYRTGDWRFTWQSGLHPFTLERLSDEQPIEFLDIARYMRDDRQQDNWRTQASRAERYREELARYLRSFGADRSEGS